MKPLNLRTRGLAQHRGLQIHTMAYFNGFGGFFGTPCIADLHLKDYTFFIHLVFV